MAGIFGRRYIKDEDFEEGEVWNVMEEKENSKSPTPRKPNKKSDSSSTISRHFSSSSSSATSRMVPRSSSSSIEAAPSKQFSAPVDIPDWSKIYGKSSKKNKNKNITSSSSSWIDVDHCHNHDGCYGNYDDDHGHNGILGYNDCDVYDDDCDGYDDDDDGMFPPHEYLARKLARSQISSFSVYEGIGRTLKGRDLSQLRNAILTKTGFLE